METMTARETFEAWRTAAPGFLDRQKKSLSQLSYGWNHPKRVSFVFGCQRSGTKMLMRILDNSRETRIYHENHATAFSDFQLRSDATVRLLAMSSPAPAQIFKPICDSQNADLLLARFPRARGLWTYRHFDDVANSAYQKWGAHQREVVTAAVKGDLTTWGWRTERLSERVLADLRRVWRDDLSELEGALLFWYMRNSFFRELGLHLHPRVLLVKYEDLVTKPEAAFRRVFTHVGAAFDKAFLGRVHSESVGRKPPPMASPAIRELCAGLEAELDAWAASAKEPPAPASVLLLINTLGVGGAERYAVTVGNWMAEHGSTVALAASRGDLAATLDPRITFHDTELGHVRADLPLAAWRIAAILQKQQPTAIIANSLAVAWIARAAQVLHHAPVIAVAHGWPQERYPVVAPLLRAVADVVVAVSPDVRDKLVAGGLPASRCEVIYNGVDCRPLGPRTGATRTAARAAMGAGPDDLLVMTVGRLTPQKAHQHVITIAGLLRERYPRLRYVIIGEGQRDEELAGLIHTAGLHGLVRLAGVRSDVPDLLGSADINLLCSDWEGMPLSTIEAMAAGLPTVATRTEGSEQLLTPECGIVVPIGDAPALAAAVARLAEDPALRASMGASAHDRALAHFSHERMARELTNLIARIVD